MAVTGVVGAFMAVGEAGCKCRRARLARKRARSPSDGVVHLRLLPGHLPAATAKKGHPSERVAFSAPGRRNDRSDHQPMSTSSARDRSSGFFTLLVSLDVMNGSINKLGEAVTSQCETDEPAEKMRGA
jgi:hypothetical protein